MAMVLNKYKPTLSQWEFITAKQKYACLQGEFGSGKSRAAVSKCIKIVNEIPGCRGIIIRNFSDDLRKSTIPLFFEYYSGSRFPPDQHKYNISTKHLEFPNGSEIDFIALDRESDISKLKNEVFTFAWLEQAEELSESLFQMCTGRCRQQKDSTKNTVFCTSNPEEGSWVNDYFYLDNLDVKQDKLDYLNEKISVEYGTWQGKNEKYIGIKAKPMENAPNLPDDYYQDLMLNLPSDQVLRYVFNKNVGKGGFVYPFNSENVVLENDYFDVTNLSQDFDTLFEMQDYGISEDNPMVFLWGIRRLDGTVYIVNEYYEYTKGIKHCSEYVKQVRPIFNIDPKFTVGCPRTFQKEGTSDRKPADLFREHKINIMSFPIHFDVRQPIIEKMIETGKLKVFERCTNLIKELKTRKWKNIKTAQDHATEAIERGVTKLLTTNTKNIADYNKPVEKKKRKLQPLTAGIMDRQF